MEEKLEQARDAQERLEEIRKSKEFYDQLHRGSEPSNDFIKNTINRVLLDRKEKDALEDLKDALKPW
jgi:hypothetical protein